MNSLQVQKRDNHERVCDFSADILQPCFILCESASFLLKSIAFIAINQKYFKNHTYQTQNHHFKPLQEAGERCNTPNRKHGSSHPTHTGKYSHFQQFHVFFLWHFKEKVKYQF